MPTRTIEAASVGGLVFTHTALGQRPVEGVANVRFWPNAVIPADY
jgi:hypothetical protein